MDLGHLRCLTEESRVKHAEIAKCNQSRILTSIHYIIITVAKRTKVVKIVHLHGRLVYVWNL
jgi:hypothetical protein